MDWEGKEYAEMLREAKDCYGSPSEFVHAMETVTRGLVKEGIDSRYLRLDLPLLHEDMEKESGWGSDEILRAFCGAASLQNSKSTAFPLNKVALYLKVTISSQNCNRGYCFMSDSEFI